MRSVKNSRPHSFFNPQNLGLKTAQKSTVNSTENLEGSQEKLGIY